MTRTDPPATGDEITQLRAYLDYHRETLRQKSDGLSAEQLNATLPPSDLTLGGMVKHLAFVEDHWVSVVFLGHGYAEPWASADWDADDDWEWHSADEQTPTELRELYDAATAASDEILATATGPEALTAHDVRSYDGPVNLRWVLLHLIEEYARHNGHADLIRQSIDGITGE